MPPKRGPQPPDPAERLVKLARIERFRVTGEARRIRERAGLSPQRIANALGVTLPTVLAWEAGVSRPRATAALRWLDYLERLQAELDRLDALGLTVEDQDQDQEEESSLAAAAAAR
jgi:transcriptional regulator with XRE-family HTH domain